MPFAISIVFIFHFLGLSFGFGYYGKKIIKKWLHSVTLKFSSPEKQNFPKGNFFSQKHFFLLIICLHLHSSSVNT